MRFTSTISKILVMCMLLAFGLVASFGMASAHQHGSAAAKPPKNPKIYPSNKKVVLTSDGNDRASFTLYGQGLVAKHVYALDFGFDGACTQVLATSFSPKTDNNGRFQVLVQASDCEPGIYSIEATGQSYPFDEYTTTIEFESSHD